MRQAGMMVLLSIYFNTRNEEYRVSFEDRSSDYIKEANIDNVEVILVPEENTSKVSGRVRKAIDYKKLAGV